MYNCLIKGTASDALAPRGAPRRSEALPVSSKQRDPNPSKNSLVRKQCCKRRMGSLISRCFLSYQRIVLRVGVPLLAPDFL